MRLCGYSGWAAVFSALCVLGGPGEAQVGGLEEHCHLDLRAAGRMPESA